ncbi:MAG TPA: glycosyltransferase [Candidatus Woesebacteria bacterium]|nr:glycosyltransferase [Candidatus Woesebacteria bacterium]
MDSDKEISIIIPTYNRIDILIRNLDLLKRQLIKYCYEIIIIDDGSDEGYLKRLTKIDNLILIKTNHGGPAAARNIGLKKAKGEIVLFINDDTIITKGFIDKHLDFHKKNKNENVAVIGPFIEPKELIDNSIMKWLVNDSNLHFKYQKAENNELPWYYFWTCNISVKKIFLIQNKLNFDEDFKVAAWEDIEFGYRAKNKNLKIYFDEKLKAYHWHHFNFEDLMKRFYSHGRGMFVISKKIPRKHLPMLAKIENRVIARIILEITFYRYTEKFLKRLVMGSKVNSNILLQYLIIGEKIKGWDYEKNKKNINC